MSKGRIRNILGTTWCIKLKLSGCVERDVELIKFHSMNIATATFATSVTIVTTTSAEAKSRKVKL